MKKEARNVRHFALKFQPLNEKGLCIETAATINLKCNEIITRGLPNRLKVFAQKQQVKHTFTVVEASIPFHALVKLVDTEDFANEKSRTLALLLEIFNVTSKLDSQNLSAENYGLNPEIIFAQITDPNKKSKPYFWKSCNYCHNSIPTCFRKQRKDDERNRISYSLSKSPVKSFNQYFNA